MVEQLTAGFINVFSSGFTILFILSGVCIGIVMGAIPGLTANMAIALVIPLTFVMPTIPAIAMLIAISKGGTFGGSISAILINAPGSPAATATAMDGFELAKKGKALKALKMALHASCIGDMFSDIILILVAAQLAKVALMCGPVERFALILFALTIIGTVSGKSLLKGLLAAAIGLLLATVGMDPIVGFPRFDFDNVNLSGGIEFVPLMIGLFAISEVMDQVEDRGITIRKLHSLPATSAVITLSKKREDQKVTVAEIKACFKTILRSSCVGTFIGALPGVGASVAAWVGYGMAKRASKNPDEFGRGALEGIAAAEAANNAVQGANLIPLLTLGIPGNMAAALLVGAFMIHGLAIGPLIFQKSGPIVYAIFVAGLVAILAYWAAGFIFIRLGGLLTKVRKEYLFPVIVIICVMGVYSLNTNLFDIMVMFAAGGLGYFMRKLELPIPPLIIAFILGPEAELTLRHSLMLSQGSLEIFIRHPFALILLVLTIITILRMATRKRG